MCAFNQIASKVRSPGCFCHCLSNFYKVFWSPFAQNLNNNIIPLLNNRCTLQCESSNFLQHKLVWESFSGLSYFLLTKIKVQYLHWVLFCNEIYINCGRNLWKLHRIYSTPFKMYAAAKSTANWSSSHSLNGGGKTLLWPHTCWVIPQHFYQH